MLLKIIIKTICSVCSQFKIMSNINVNYFYYPIYQDYNKLENNFFNKPQSFSLKFALAKKKYDSYIYTYV